MMRRTVSFKVYLLIVVGCALAGVLLAVLTSCGSQAESKTPSSCTAALDAAEVVIGKASDALSIVGKAIDSFVAGDVQAVYDANDELQTLGDEVGDDADNYRRLAAECRSAG
jgi:hypothetical protein